jgi:integrase
MPQTPKYCHHKGRDLAFVKINGRMIYLGKYGSPESRDRYDEEIIKWRRDNDLAATHTTTIGQLCLAFMQHAEDYYRDRDGRPTREADNFRQALRPLIRLYRTLPTAKFDARRLLEVREELAQVHVRRQVNKNVSRIKSVFRWGVLRGMVPAHIVSELECVRGLQPGRGSAREGDEVLPVPEEDFHAAVAVMTPNVAAICRLLYLTGARVSEIRLMQVGDIDTTGDVWLYRPGAHKNAWRGKTRTVCIGPQGQAVLMAFIGDAVQGDQFVFLSRTGKPYTLNGLESSVRGACKRAGVDHWSPGRLRHNTATNTRRKYGLDGARAVLEHSESSTTEIYAERDLQQRLEIMREIG